MTKTFVNPTPRRVYSLSFIERNLNLRDTPSLLFTGPLDADCVIQTSHFIMEDLFAANPEWENTQWKYVRETPEWIPVFRYAGSYALLASMLHIEIMLDPYLREKDFDYWCVPKEEPRDQYYVLSKDQETFVSPSFVIRDAIGNVHSEVSEDVYPVSPRMGEAQKQLNAWIEFTLTL